ncbi:serine hydrolase domain-containing protein [Rhizobium rhizogenes]|uniref:serine hydrolase domain-containing protein n=1 Tax=Rhizobium rhizogenes TaxID=359 RepID=UPI00157357CE|nr:serine hydrolase [Rhizobium rhizogenes]NTF83935.1 serine hydrolase [Rhizobium rhizogenes]
MSGNGYRNALLERQIPRRSLLKKTLAAPLALATPSFAAVDIAWAAGSSSPRGDFTPALAADSLAIGASSDLGIDAKALHAVLEKVQGGRANIHSVLVLRHGKLAAELYRPGFDRSIYSLWASRRQFAQANLHDMRSVSKSVVGLLYGILLDRGEVPGIDTSVSSLYPECSALHDDTSRRVICIRHLLTMTAGLAWTEPSPVLRASSTDEVGLALRPCAYSYVFQRDVVAPPGTLFTYSGGLTAILAEIMERSTKRSLRQIAAENLFVPLGITDWEWVGDVYGKPMAPAGLRLRPRDLIKLGATMLAGGEWQGRRVVPAGWIARSITPSIMTAPVGGYGFLWWSMTTRWKDRDLSVTAAIGNGGQRLFLVPDLDLAVVTTAGNYGDPAIAAPINAILHSVVRTVSA